MDDLNGVRSWARKWDNSLFKLKGIPSMFHDLKKVRLATRPPRFGSSVYNVGHPLGTPAKISWQSHVLRHNVFDDSSSPFCHDIGLQGTYSTDLDQFPGKN